jgi:HAD superfamily hydrolase (TIGR01484 family)
MTPLATVSPAALRHVRALLFDVDDTLTTHGSLTADAYSALHRAKTSGLIMVPVTGRPAGWCDHIARMWPVDAVVGENGAFWFYRDSVAGKLQRRHVKDDTARAADRLALDIVAAQILSEVPGAALASDQGYRVADIAIDFCEDVPRLDDAAVLRIKARMECAGLTAKVSSIHVNGWFGGYDKLSTTRAMFKEQFGIDLDSQRDSCVFVGDSPNDEPMFEFFPLSVGVANVRHAAAHMSALPHYVTERECGAGFVEVVEALLKARHFAHPQAGSAHD